VVVENKPGANGIIGTNAVAKSAPDGYTMVYSSGAENAINPHVQKAMPYDLLGDFVPITSFSRTPLFLASRRDLPATSVKDLITLIQSRPGELTYGSWGIGSLGHVGMELILRQSNLKILHVPFVGGPPAFNALMGGQIDMMLMPAGAAIPLRKAARIKVFAVTLPYRASFMPDIPTMKEEGYDVNIALTNGFLIPSKTPTTIVQKLSVEIIEVLRKPKVEAALKAQGTELLVLSQQAYGELLRQEQIRWGEVVRSANVKIQ
jgi:tripartite-type tricarboxylate transporter receptor subunit TctC